ncbi:MAG: hypothetical protein ACRC5T_10520 [Cetobacterium sp.]
MIKKKFTLTSDMIQLADEGGAELSHKSEQQLGFKTAHKKPLKPEKVTLTLLVDKSFRMEIKSWCALKNMTITEAIQRGFKLLKTTAE